MVNPLTPLDFLAVSGQTGDLLTTATVNITTGNTALLCNKPDTTSAFFTEAENGFVTWDSFYSDTWVQLDVDGEYFRLRGYASEDAADSNWTIQKTFDYGLTWTSYSEFFRSSTQALFVFGGIYNAISDVGYVPAMHRSQAGIDFRLYLFANRMTTYDSYITLFPASGSYQRVSEGRIIRLSSGTLILPAYTTTTSEWTDDVSTGVYRCPAGANPSLLASWSYIEGSGCGMRRGMQEVQAVETPDHNVMLWANNEGCYLATQLWENDCQTPGETLFTNITSPRTKSDIIRLSDGRYAMAWCSTKPNPGTPNYIGAPSNANEGPRSNVVVAFSDDLKIWYDHHVIYKGVFIYELYLQEISGKLRVRFWDWINGQTQAQYQYAYDKWSVLTLAEMKAYHDLGADTTQSNGEISVVRVLPAAIATGNDIVLATVIAINTTAAVTEGITVNPYVVPSRLISISPRILTAQGYRPCRIFELTSDGFMLRRMFMER